jgi:predicted dehydrogenase
VVSVGIIGLGRMGLKHAEIIAGLSGARIGAVADLDPVRLRQAADRFRVDGYARAEQLCARTDLDAVSICTPDWAHLAPAVAALSSGKHVFVEKPLADNERDARQIAAAARAANVKLMVGHLLRFDVRYAEARTTIAQGVVGEIVQVSAKRNSYIDGPLYYGPRCSLPFHLALHEIDVLQWMLASPVVRVYAESASKVLRDRDMADTLLSLLRFANGAIASLEHCWVLRRGCGAQTLGPQMEIVGTKGSIQLIGNGGIEIATAGGLSLPDLAILGRLPSDALTGALASALQSFIQCIANDTEPPITADDGVAAVRVAAAIVRSIDAQSPVPIEQL